MSVNVAPSERAVVGSDTATMFESSMISEDTSEVVSKSPRRAPVLFVGTIEEATISLVPTGVRKPLDLAESQTTRDLGFWSPLLVSFRPGPRR
jgi:hypothetical protein